MRLRLGAMVAGLVLGLVGASAPAVAAEDTAIILDASGSMWGQINSEAKITSAKRVLGDILTNTPADRRLGLFAYGHRREGDCKDIEEIAPIGADRAAMTAAVARLTPKGRTPMADAIKFAAERLHFTKRKATIVLVSDGIETCDSDPCGTVAALERAGADLTVHVVGFDIAEETARAQLQCLAETTGGRFVVASNAAELSSALQSTVAAPPATRDPANLHLRVTELQGGLPIEKGVTWTVTPASGGAAVLSKEDAGKMDAKVAPGTYDVTAVRTRDGLKGEAKGIVITAGASKTVTIALEFPVAATVRSEPSKHAGSGTNIRVFWTGPDRRGDFIAITKKGDAAGASEAYAYVRTGNPVEIRLPVKPGLYEIRYVLGYPYRVLSAIDIEAVPSAATLDGPAEVTAGSEVSVAFTGPPANSSDFVTIARPGDPDKSYMDYAYTRNGNPAKVRAPLEAGPYEFRFVQGGSKVLARRPVTIVAAIATVTSKTAAIAGETLSISFTGPPVGASDFITVTEPGAPDNKYMDYAYIRNGSPAKVRMPLDAGAYEIRYVQAGSKVLARQAVTVTPAAATLSGPSTAIAGTAIAVTFTGPPPGPSDYIAIAHADAEDRSYAAYTYVSRGSPLEIKAPTTPGAYELRFIQAGKKVLARRPISITAP